MTDSSISPAALKRAHITLVLKRGLKNSKKTKDYINKNQITLKFFSPNFSEVFDRNSVRNTVLKNWKKPVDKGKTFEALVTDLLKAFEWLPHNLILAKLNTYGFSLSVTKVIHNCLP